MTGLRNPTDVWVVSRGVCVSVSIHLRIAESESSSFEQKELVLESLVEFCKEPSLIVGKSLNPF